MSRLLTVGLLLCGVALNPSWPARGEPSAEQTKRADRYGDPLPEGAIARLGTLRLRHCSQVTSVAYSPDARLLATGGFDNTVHLWQSSTGKELSHFVLRETHSPAAAHVAFSPDGSLLAASRSGEGTVHLWDVITGKERKGCSIPNDETFSAITFSSDGKTLAAICCARKGSEIQNRLHFWRVKTGEEVTGFKSPERRIWSIAFAPDSKSLAIGQDGEVCVCDAGTGRKLRTLRRGDGHFAVVAFSSGGVIASATQDEKVVRLWDAATGREKHVLRGHTEVIGSLAFSADGKRLVSASVGDATFRVWDVARGEVVLEHRGLSAISAGCVALSPDGKTVAEGSINSIFALRRWDVATNKEIIVAPGHLFPVGFVAFTPDDHVVTSGAGYLHDGGLRIWNVADGRQLNHLEGDHDVICRLAVSADGRTAAAAKRDGTIQLWDLKAGNPTKRLRSDAGPAFCLSFAPDGKTLAVGYTAITKGYACSIIWWDVASAKTVRRWPVPGTGFQSLVFDPEGRRLLSLGVKVNLWNIADGKELGEFRMPRAHGSLHNLAHFSPDGTFLAVPCYPQGFVVWEVATRNFLGRFDGNGAASRSVAFSRDGRLLACGKDDGTVEVWDTLTWTLAAKRQGPKGWIFSVAFSADGRLLGSGHEDTTALIWDVPSLWAPTKPATALTRDQLEALWTQLGSGQSSEALRAVAALNQARADTLPFLSKHVHPARAVGAKSVDRLIADLDADTFAVREKAVRGLQARGPAVIPALRKAMRANPTPEARCRMIAVLEVVGSKKPHELMTAEERRAVRAVAVLEQIGTSEARHLLDELAGGDAEARLSREARSARDRLQSPQRQRGKSPSPR